MARKRLGGKKSKGKGSKKSSGVLAVQGPTGPSLKREKDYRAEDDFRTMERAEEVRGDKSRHSAAMDHGRKRIAAMHRIMAKSGSERLERRAAAGGRR